MPQDPILEHLLKHSPSSVLQVREVMDNFFLEMTEGSLAPDSLESATYGNVDGEPLRLDIYRPTGDDGPAPVLVYLHGGGYIMGSSATYHGVCARFAQAGFVVFSVNYRLAPEHPFPAGLDDCILALQWVFQHASDYAGDSERLVVVGDSAGGNLTAATSIHFAQHEDQSPLALALVYPTLIPPADANWEDHGSVPAMLKSAYVGDNDFQEMCSDWRYNPIMAAQDLPPTCLVCGSGDFLINDCRALAQELASSGTPCEEHYFDDMPHGFIQMEPLYEEAKWAIERIAEFLHKQL